MKTESILKAVAAVFLAAALAGALQAVRFKMDRDSALARLSALGQGVGDAMSHGDASEQVKAGQKPGVSRTFELLDLLSQKDATIKRLKVQMAEMKAGKFPREQPPPRPPPLPRATAEPPIESPPVPGADDAHKLSPAALSMDFKDNIDFLKSLDVSDTSSEEQANHADLINRLARIQNLSAKIHDSPDGAEAPELGRQLLDAASDLDGALAQERSMIFYVVGRGFGYDREGARAFAKYAEYINLMTSSDAIRPK